MTALEAIQIMDFARFVNSWNISVLKYTTQKPQSVSSFHDIICRKVTYCIFHCAGKVGVNTGAKLSPSVVLSVEQEVRAHDGDAHGHDAQDDQDQHHEAVHVVDFVGPKGREDEVPEEKRTGNMSPAAKINLLHKRKTCYIKEKRSVLQQ